MCLTPFLDHPTLHLIVLSAKVASDTTRPAEEMIDSVKEEGFDCPSSFVGRADEIDDQTGEAVYTAMDIETPRPQFLISIHVP